MKPAEISEIKKGSIAEKAGLKPGDKITSINGRVLRDILDYQFCAVDERVELDVTRDGTQIYVELLNPDYESLGIVFSTSLFDGIKTCANKCVFCFIDQLPPGMRDAVYVKDDDYRLSFLYGNFVTFTNVKDEDIDRIIEDRLSPIYASLHATNPELRNKMLGRKKDDKTLEYIKRLSDAGIELHIQMVMCPGLNDKEELDRSISDLSSKFAEVASVGLVPVGLTAYRDGLYSLRSFEKQEIIELIEQAGKWQAKFEEEKGCAWLYIADEFYIAAGYDLPPSEHYGDYPQIENGIGLSRLFIDEAADKIAEIVEASDKDKAEKGLPGDAENVAEIVKLGDAKRRKLNLAVATGELFAPILKGMLQGIRQGIVREAGDALELEIDVIPVRNEYFGGKVNVTGLLTGSDIAAGVKSWLVEHEKDDKFKKPDILIIPGVVLNADGLLLDGYKPERLAEELDLEVRVVDSSGAGFICGIMEAIVG